MAQKIFIVVNEHPLEAAALAMGVKLHKKLKEMGVDVGQKPVKITGEIRSKSITILRSDIGFRGRQRTVDVLNLAGAHPESLVFSFHNYGIDRRTSLVGSFVGQFLRQKELPQSQQSDVGKIHKRNNLFEIVKSTALPGFSGKLFFIEMASFSRTWRDKKTGKTHDAFSVKTAKSLGFLEKNVVDALAKQMCRFFKKKLGRIPRAMPKPRPKRKTKPKTTQRRRHKF